LEKKSKKKCIIGWFKWIVGRNLKFKNSKIQKILNSKIQKCSVPLNSNSKM
jgi:hypothetical protein